MRAQRDADEEHRRDGRTYPRCPTCGVIWRQSGNATGHCSGCHATFDSLAAFDRHRTTGADGGRECRYPASVVRDDGVPVFECRIAAGVTYWRLRLSEADRERFAELVRRRVCIDSRRAEGPGRSD